MTSALKNWCRTVLVLLSLAGCSPDEGEAYQPRFADTPPDASRPLVFGVHPLHNPHRLFQVYQPLVDHLNRNLGVRLKLEASKNYQDFEAKLAARHFAFSLPNPYQTVESRRHGYRVFAKMAEDDQFRGIILVRKDSGIETPAELRGKAVSYPARTALAATMLPQWFLHHSGVDVRRDIENRYVGSQESSIMNVYLGQSAAGATWPPPWRAFVRANPEIAAQLEVKWQTEPLINNGVVARDDMPAELVTRFADLLANLDKTQQGRAILAGMELGGFERADDAAFQPVADFIEQFERVIGPIKEAGQ